MFLFIRTNIFFPYELDYDSIYIFVLLLINKSMDEILDPLNSIRMFPLTFIAATVSFNIVYHPK